MEYNNESIKIIESKELNDLMHKRDFRFCNFSTHSTNGEKSYTFSNLDFNQSEKPSISCKVSPFKNTFEFSYIVDGTMLRLSTGEMGCFHDEGRFKTFYNQILKTACKIEEKNYFIYLQN